MSARPPLLAASLAFAAAGPACGDDSGDALGRSDGAAGPADYGFLFPDLSFADAGAMDLSPAPDSTSPDLGTSDARVDAGNVGPDAGPGPDASDLCLDGPKKPLPPGSLTIVGGTRQPTSLSLSAAQLMAVVGLAEGSSFGADCSGTLIANRVVLTAGHCTEGVPATDFQVLFGQDDENPVLAVGVTQKTEHSIQDLTLLTLATDPTTQIAVQPIPIFRGTLNSSHVGRTIEAAGYGDTETFDTGRYFVAVDIEVVETDTFGINGGGVQGVCYGDSGGPALMVAPEGDVRVIGEISEGDAACAQRDNFVRVDTLRSFIESLTGPTPVAPNVDECNRLGLIGSCEGQVARWCDEGVVRERDCASCGETCLYLGARIGFDCHPDPLYCGELDYLGWCNGTVSEWCNEMNQREGYDCADDGQTCGFIDPEIGYYCQ